MHRVLVIMFTDIVRYTQLMAEDEPRALQVLRENRELHQSLLEKYNGNLLKEMGDGVLASFESNTQALRCAGELVRISQQSGISLRVGLHVGEVVLQDNDIFGDGVNIASRVQEMAEPDQVLFTDKVYDDIRNKSEFRTESVGTFHLKHVVKPVQLHTVNFSGRSHPGNIQRPKGNGLRKRLFLGTLAVIAAIAGLAVIIQYFDQPGELGLLEREVPSIAALPFANISEDEELNYLGFALVDEVINALSYLKQITIRPSTTVRQYAEQPVIIPEKVAEDLAVEYILMGHYLRVHDSLRLNLELIKATSNDLLWRGTVKEEISDLFRLQDEVAQRVIDGLSVQFSNEERMRMSRDEPTDPLAYDYYLKALAAPQSIGGNQMAVEWLEKAIESDSSFAPPYAELGNRKYYMTRYALLGNEEEAVEEILNILDKALAINEDYLPAMGLLSFVYTELNQMHEALEVAEKMVSINENNALGHFCKGYVYRYVGLVNKAVREMEWAVRIDPHDPQFRSIGISYNLAGRFQDAIEALKYQDSSGFCESWKGLTYVRMDQYDDARRELEKAMMLDPSGLLGKWSQMILQYLKESDIDWDELESIESEVEDPESMYSWSLINIIHGDTEGFLEMFRKAVESGYYPVEGFRKDPLLDGVRDLPAFSAILQLAMDKHEAFVSRLAVRD